MASDEYVSHAESSRLKKIHKCQKKILEEKLNENLHSEMHYRLDKKIGNGMPAANLEPTIR